MYRVTVTNGTVCSSMIFAAENKEVACTKALAEVAQALSYTATAHTYVSPVKEGEDDRSHGAIPRVITIYYRYNDSDTEEVMRFRKEGLMSLIEAKEILSEQISTLKCHNKEIVFYEITRK